MSNAALTKPLPEWPEPGEAPAIAIPGVVESLERTIRLGVTYANAAQAAGISRHSLYRALRNGEDAERRAARGELLSSTELWYLAVWERLRSAVGKGEVDLVTSIQRAGHGRTVEEVVERRADGSVRTKATKVEGDWRAHAFILERRHRAGWGRGPVQHDVVVSGDAGQAVQEDGRTVEVVVNLQDWSRDELVRVLEAGGE